MKRLVRWSLSLTALLAVSAIAQEPNENMRFKIAPEGKPQIEVAKPLGPQFGFETKVVKGAPYSATAEAETIQMLADGNRIRKKTATTVYRDSEGRTRRETAGKTPGVAGEVFISDPVSGANYSLYPERRVAVKAESVIQLKIVEEKKLIEQKIKQSTAEGELPVSVNINGQAIPWDQLTDEQRDAAKQKMLAAKEISVEVKSGKPPADGAIMRKKPGTTESLGQQTIEGVACEGKRTTVTIPAGAIGNDLPLNIVSEEWYSPELQVYVLTKQSDPRHGETVYRLTNINRGEPARTLFEVPADYTLQENWPPKAKKRRPEEQ